LTRPFQWSAIVLGGRGYVEPEAAGADWEKAMRFVVS